MYQLDAASLSKSQRNIKLPFQLSITVDGGGTLDIRVREILRLLPGRRLALLAEAGNKKLLIKLFLGRTARKYQQRELRGVDAIGSTGVPTPALLWQGALPDSQGLALAFEYIDHAPTLAEAFKNTNNQAKRLSVMTRVMPILAQLHQGGVLQKDIHPGNFLMTKQAAYVIDGGNVVKKTAMFSSKTVSNARGCFSTKALSEASSLNNLALFFAQFQSRFDPLIPQALEKYQRHRDWPENDSREYLLISKMEKHREARKVDYVQKAFRECTRISCRSSFRRFQVCERQYDTPAMQLLLTSLDAAIDQARATGNLLKDGNSATVARIESPAGTLVVKRYNLKNFAHRLQRACRRSRAWVSWGNIFRLEFLGIKTADPVALVEERFGPFRLRTYLVTKYIAGPDASSLSDLADPTPALASIATILQDLTRASITHGDLKASNFLLGPAGPVIIDLDSMREHRREQSFQPALKKDLARFIDNWSDNLRVGRIFAEILHNNQHGRRAKTHE